LPRIYLERKVQILKPSIILISPQLGENIGAAARAMHNFGLDDLRLVNPRDGWPNRDAVDVARNALKIIENTKIYSSLKDAVADINLLYATTARPRDMVKPVVTARSCAENLWLGSAQIKNAIMFGPERTGMSNDDIVLADNIVTIPANEDNTSLNLAQAVSIICYEWFAFGTRNGVQESLPPGGSSPAAKSEINLMLEHLQAELEIKGFFGSSKMRPRMIRNLGNIFTRNNLTSQEVRTLRGVINYLTRN